MFTQSLLKLAKFGLTAAVATAFASDPIGTEFTYQGRLSKSGAPLSGTADFVFSLWDDAANGTQIGDGLQVNNVDVVDGLFTVQLDFGAGAFSGDTRFLQIEVSSPAGGGELTVLTPRQELTPTPFANAVRGITVDAVGNVGIGTQQPVAGFQVAPGDSGFDLVYGQGDNGSGHTQLAFGLSELSGGYPMLQAISRSGSEWGDLVLNPYAGHVGVGTSNAHGKLTVRSEGGDGHWMSFNDNSDNTVWHLTNKHGGFDLVQTGVADYRLFVSASGAVGLGTGDPKGRFQFGPWGALSDANSAITVGSNYYETDGQYWLMDWNKPATWMRFVPGSASDRWVRLEYYDQGGPFEMATFGKDQAYILADRVGINDSTPEYTLDVNGTINANALEVKYDAEIAGTTTTAVLKITGGGDLAEPFDVAAAGPGCGSPTDDAQLVAPGMVVCIDPDHPGALRIASRAYDTTVAGVISGAGGVNPGLTLQQPGTLADGTHAVALSGRVYCYVDADAGGAVTPGDLLTTSPTPGHAMKVGDRDRAGGAVIGKSMTGLESGRGLVLVLVNLQ
jgi:hypothetical protein